MKDKTMVVMLCAALAACGGDGDAPAEQQGGGGGEGGGRDGGGGYGGYPTDDLRCDGPGARFVTEVVELDYGPGQDHGRDAMPDIVLGPPRGGGTSVGSMDVVSIGNGGVIGVSFAGNGIIDGPGPDFVVFENAFHTNGVVFAELATVEVSSDGMSWVAFPCDAEEPPYGTCAGHTPVLLDGDLGPIDPATAGGDAFDLADVGVAEARFVRIVDRADLEGLDGVFDLDAVGIVNAACP